MITKMECLALLFDLRAKGHDVDEALNSLIKSKSPTIEIIKFINDKQELNVRKFYEKLRKSYNKGNSILYKNIVKSTDEDLEEDPRGVLCTLASLQLQILLFNERINDNNFLQNTRFDEISKVLLNYYNTKDIIPCIKLLTLVKYDLKVLEEISK